MTHTARRILMLAWLVFNGMACTTSPISHRSEKAQDALDAELFIACHDVDPVRVKAALAAGSDPNRRGGDWLQNLIDDQRKPGQPLTWHAIRGYQKTPFMVSLSSWADPLSTDEVAQALLANGAETEAADRNGATVLEYAINGGATLTALRLIRQGVNVNTMTEIYIDADEGTPLWKAVHRRNTPVVRALLEAGANPNTPSVCGVPPLIEGIENGSIVRLLIEHGADVNQPLPNFVTNTAGHVFEWPKHPLIYAIEACNSYSPINTIQELLDAGATLGDLAGVPSDEFYNFYGTSSEERLRQLIALGAPLFNPNELGDTLLHEAVRWPEQIDIVKILLEIPDVPVDFGLNNPEGSSPLVDAYEADNLSAGKLLLDAGASPNAVIPFRGDPLLRAAVHDNRPAWVALLKAAGATLD